jgi:hypothetical protein
LAIAAFVHAYDPTGIVTLFLSLQLEPTDTIFEMQSMIANHLPMEWLKWLVEFNIVYLDLLLARVS